MKFGRNTTDPEAIAFWAAVEETTKAAKDMPAWKKAGVDINPDHFETFGPTTSRPPKK